MNGYFRATAAACIILTLQTISVPAQELHETPPPLFFREDWREIPPTTPLTQDHVLTGGLVLALHGPGRDMIKKSHHDQPLDDPYYVWSGQCEGTWAVTLEKRDVPADLTNGAVRWKTKNFDRVTRVVLGLGDGSWLVSARGTGETPDWHEFTVGLAGMTWLTLDMDTVRAGNTVESPDLSHVIAVGFTDLDEGGQSASCTRLDWIEVYGRPLER